MPKEWNYQIDCLNLITGNKKNRQGKKININTVKYASFPELGFASIKCFRGN